MSAIIRNYISKKIGEVLRINDIFHQLEVPLKEHEKPILQWSCKTLNNQDDWDILNTIVGLNYEKDIIKQVNIVPTNGKTAKVEFVLHEEPYFNTLLINGTTHGLEKRDDHMVFEYSSPNIAKPFHVGHLRSTIIGNFLANIYKHLNFQVTKINYLGDWGTQLGLLYVGMEMLGVTSEQIQSAPIDTMYKAYVLANKAAESDAFISQKARKLFRDLEIDDVNSELKRTFNLYRDFTKIELELIYKRLGINFDIYEWESHYSEKYITDVVQKLEDNNMLLVEKDGRKAVNINQRKVPIIKSDGGTLYLTRDIAALLSRWQRFKFTRIFYVVENGQSDHFNACFEIAKATCNDLDDTKLKHVKFGRIHGMSTRKGQAIFLANLLDEARDRMYEKQKQSSTTKVVLDSGISDILGISAVIVNDLKQRRQRDYLFNWEKALQMSGDTGIKLQYTHCRLKSLLEQQANNIVISDITPNINYLKEPEALETLYQISKFTQSIWQSKEQLESCILVNYLFALCNTTSKALKCLPIKSEMNDMKKLNRLLLFASVKNILKRGMEILGLKPLNKM